MLIQKNEFITETQAEQSTAIFWTMQMYAQYLKRQRLSQDFSFHCFGFSKEKDFYQYCDNLLSLV